MGIVDRSSRSRWLSAWCVLSAAGSILGTAHAAVGRTVGHASVSAHGAAQYSIPLWTPPGTNGLKPSLSLNYSSASGNGLMGMGWSLGGLSSITRCNRTIGQDGAAGAVTVGIGDPLCLEGERLMLVSGSQNAEGSTYQTEVESFRRVTAQGQTGNGPQSLLLEGNDGLIYEYGTTADSRIEVYGSPHVHEWALSRIRDCAGNSIEFVYAEETANSSYRPIEIRWTGNSERNVAPVYRLKIVYKTAARPDLLHGYRYDQTVTAIKRPADRSPAHRSYRCHLRACRSGRDVVAAVRADL